MEQQRRQAEMKLSCSICLDVLKDPVTVACGHNYCLSCIGSFWDGEDARGVYSCPLCRRSFASRPVLVKNIMLAELVEERRGAELPDDCRHAAAEDVAEDVACDVCTGTKRKAAKSCQVCVASYCAQHLQPHFQSPPLKRHKLVEPSRSLQENICPRHCELMNMFCRSDQCCVCNLCCDEHRGHDIVSAAAERAEKQEELDENVQKVQQSIRERRNELEELRREDEAISCSARQAAEQSGKIFAELIGVLQRRSSDAKRQVALQQEAEASRVKVLQEKLDQEVVELEKEEVELQRLSHTNDHTWFLQRYRPPPASTATPLRAKPDRLSFFQDVMAYARDTKDQLMDVLSQKCPEAEPRSRAELLRHSRSVRLDPNTACSALLLSHCQGKVTHDPQNPPYSRHPDRFLHNPQVLGREGLTGRAYWEVELSGGGTVAAAYWDVERSGDDSMLGFNCKSWSLSCYARGVTFTHNKVPTNISGPAPSRVGVFLDHRAGILAFYGIAEGDATLLHRVETTFTQPLHVGIRLYSGSAELK